MEKQKKIKIIITLGPATNQEADLALMKSKDIDFVRVNMSHSSLADLEYFINLAKKIDIPFIIDTEGSQIRSGNLLADDIRIEENELIRISNQSTVGNRQEISLRPAHIIENLEKGDLIYLDFGSLILRVVDESFVSQGYITAQAISEGILGKNKGVVIDPVVKKDFNLPVLSTKDYQSIKMGLKYGLDHILVSFVRQGKDIDIVRQVTENKMKIFSKVECSDALENIDAIINKSDYLLIDRGDLSKEIPIEKVPFIQKMILYKAKKQNKGVFVATNLLETMIKEPKPTRAEIHDIVTTILDGAYGLTLAAETAIGKYPRECINMLNTVIHHTESVIDFDKMPNHNQFLELLERNNYLTDQDSFSLIIEPHGGKLVNRVMNYPLDQLYLDSLQKVNLNQELQMDLEQIAIGSFSPLEGFMGQEDFEGVLDNMRLANGIVWTIPVILDISEAVAANISIGDNVALTDDEGIMAILHVSDKYTFNQKEVAQKLYGTDSQKHHGVRWLQNLKPVLLGGKIDFMRRRKSVFQEYELTPQQVRRLFKERGWIKVVGFHTRNVIHRSHEFIQLKAMADENCDGLFVHPIIGKKKSGDFHVQYIIDSYNKMMKDFYPKSKVVFATFSTFSRYAGPREAVFTALCRKNFGCSHFIVGRDHTGVGDFYPPNASHEIFDQFPDLGIKPVKFDKVFYSQKHQKYFHEKEALDHPQEDKMHISGTQAREMFNNTKQPPEWFMRPEISNIILEAIKDKREVFVQEKETKPGVSSSNPRRCRC